MGIRRGDEDLNLAESVAQKDMPDNSYLRYRVSSLLSIYASPRLIS